MSDGLIPNRYAKALYKYAVEQGDASSVYAQVSKLAESYVAETGMAKAIENPFLPVKDKEAVLNAASGASPESSAGKFFKLVLSHGREALLQNMALAYGKLYREQRHISQVEITTAAALAEPELNKIREYVKGYLNGYTIEFSEKVNPDLIGGFTIRIDSKLLDASISNELRNLRLKLLSKK